MKKIIFYHAYLYGSNYRTIMLDQFRCILTSKLFQECDKLYIGIAKDEHPGDGVEWITAFWSFPSSKVKKQLHEKVEIVVYKENNEIIPTLKLLREYARRNSDDYVCFLHPKGITHYTIPTEDWRKYMEYFVVERWQDCIQKLDEGYDACGVMWNRDTVYGDYPHFSGCMFWANTNYIRTLDDSFLDMQWRYGGEFWIGSNKQGKIFEFHNSHMNDKERFAVSGSHYSLPYPRENYYKP